MIWAGDFFSITSGGLSGWATRHLIKTPSGKRTDQVHFGIIADPVYDAEGHFVDFETRESQARGISTLRFFKQYLGEQVYLYRLPDITEKQGRQLVRSISKIGRAPYGWKDIAQAGFDAFCLLLSLQRPPYTAQQFQVSANLNYICTEVPAFGAAQIDRPVEPPDFPDIWVIPTVYLQAIEEGRLQPPYYKGNLQDIYRQLKNKS